MTTTLTKFEVGDKVLLNPNMDSWRIANSYPQVVTSEPAEVLQDYGTNVRIGKASWLKGWLRGEGEETWNHDKLIPYINPDKPVLWIDPKDRFNPGGFIYTDKFGAPIDQCTPECSICYPKPKIDLLACRGQPLDPVQHPPHYARWTMEPIEFIAINNLPWWLANVIKYTMRHDAKDGLQDLYKARSYLDMKIRETEGIKEFWVKPVAEERALNLGKA